MFTKKTDYGIRGLLHLAARRGDAPTLVSEVSAEEHIPASFLNKIFQQLAHSGILRSQRGSHGGFRLAVDPSDLTLKKIVEALEGRLDVARTHWQRSGTVTIETVGTLWRRLQVQVEQYLESTTLGDLLGKYWYGRNSKK